MNRNIMHIGDIDVKWQLPFPEALIFVTDLEHTALVFHEPQ